ncbi:MAG: DNA glycosylase [Lachnospiraceae bacterium]|nr:DNA glycosylase [Lachnospiraceae bacterium]
MEERYQIKIRNLNLARIADSGQCFRWKRMEMETEADGGGDVYEIPAFHRKLKVMQQGEVFTFFCGEREFHEIWENYLDLKEPYDRYLASVDENDDFLKQASLFGGGIRILRQEPWETAVSFLISQCNNIPRIRGCIEKLCYYFGDEKYYFPSAERLAGLKGNELECFRSRCSLGYRDEYILNLARRVTEGSFSLEECGKLSYKECTAELRKLQGVGAKVADCIALFGFHKIDAFPVDVHIKQILYEHYYDRELEAFSGKKQVEMMVERHFSRYSGYRGIVQQWIFAYELYRKLYS